MNLLFSIPLTIIGTLLLGHYKQTHLIKICSCSSFVSRWKQNRCHYRSMKMTQHSRLHSIDRMLDTLVRRCAIKTEKIICWYRSKTYIWLWSCIIISVRVKTLGGRRKTMPEINFYIPEYAMNNQLFHGVSWNCIIES